MTAEQQDPKAGSFRVWPSRRMVRPFTIGPEDIDLVDIANALARQCRFLGHVSGFISVGEHSLVVSRLLEERGESRLIQATGLLHDASEAYLGDISGPLKRLPAFDGYREVEELVERVIAAKYGLPFPYPPVVKVCDNESADLEMYGADGVGPLRERSLADGPSIDEVVSMFLARAAELGLTGP